MERSAYEAMAATQGHHWWFVARRRVLDAALRSLKLPAQARILEAGCGPGGNLPLLQRHGRVSAVEMDDAARAQASVLSGLPVQPGHLPDALPFEGEAFDLICLFDVLEHVPDDEAALRTLRGRLAPGGRVLLTVPAYPWLFSAHDRHHHHHRRYTAAQLRSCAARAGLHCARLGYFNTLLFPPAALARWWSRGRQAASSAAQVPAPWLNALLGEVFAAERWVVPHTLFPFGLSLMAVLHAPA